MRVSVKELPTTFRCTIPPLAMGLVLGLLGFVGNWFKFELFFGVDFLFGTFFVMVAILRYGSAPGVVSGVLAGSCTYLLWQHPWAIVIFGGEALFVAIWTQRRSHEIVVADFLYWICCGGPLVWIFYHQVMAVQIQPTILIILKQAINGIICALLALLANLAIQSLRKTGDCLPSFRQLLFAAMVSLTVLPALAAFTLELRGFLKEEQGRLAARADRLASITNSMLNQWVREHQQGVLTLSRLVGDPETASPGAMQKLLVTIQSSSGFSRMGVFDRNAISRAYLPAVNESGRSTIGVDLSDRPYLPVLRERKIPLITDILTTRVMNPGEHFVAFIAPVLRDAEFLGFCSGVVDLAPLREMLTAMVGSAPADLTLLDRGGRVIVSTRKELAIMDQFRRSAGGTTRVLGKDTFHWIPSPASGTSNMQRWRSSLVVKEVTLGADVGWTLVCEMSLLPLLADLSAETIRTLSTLALLILVTIVLSHLFSRMFVRALSQLQTVTREFPRQIIAEPGFQVWPRSRIHEIDHLIANFREMSLALHNSFTSQRLLTESLEQRVAERTEELTESRDNYRTFLETMDDMIIIAALDGSILYVNDAVTKKLGYDEEELQRMNLIEFHPPEFRAEAGEIVMAMMRRERNSCPLPLLKKNGELLPVETRIWFGPWDRHEAVFGISKDLSELQAALDMFQKLFENNPSPMAISSAITQQFTQVNEAFLTLLQYRREEVLGATATELGLFPDVSLYAAGAQYLHETGSLRDYEMRIKTKSGDIRTGIFAGAVIHVQGEPLNFTVMSDITEMKRRDELVSALVEEKSRVVAMEKEKRHLKEKELLIKDLHDGIGGIVTNIAMLGQYGLLQGSAANCHDIMGKITALATDGAAEVRSFMNSLESSESSWSDLLAEIKEHAVRMLEPHRIILEVDSHIHGHQESIGVFRYVNIVRICREIIANIVKHARARQVRLSFQVLPGRFELSLSDDGVGFDPGVIRRRGLANMHARVHDIGGILTITSTRGVTISLSLLLDERIQPEQPCI